MSDQEKQPQHYGHEPGGTWWGCVTCNPNNTLESDPLKGLRKLVHTPLEEELIAVIYKCRWVDGIKKDASLVSDKELAKAIMLFLKYGMK